MADERALRHALHNLLDNAIRYGEGKQVSVTVRRATVNRFPHVSIEVADQGPGIPPEELSRVFDAFFRGSRAIRDQIHGTGLGLNIVKTIAEAHGGEAAVRSYPGEGAHFLLHLPCPENLTFNDSGNS
jgi:signal transduction histidine kinase